MDSLQQNLLEAINNVIDGRLQDLKLDTTITAVVKSAKNIDGSYKLNYLGADFIAYPLFSNMFFTIGEAVLVLIPDSNWENNKKLILAPATEKILSGGSVSLEGVIRYDAPQALTEEEKRQVWANIGIEMGDEVTY